MQSITNVNIPLRNENIKKIYRLILMVEEAQQGSKLNENKAREVWTAAKKWEENKFRKCSSQTDANYQNIVQTKLNLLHSRLTAIKEKLKFNRQKEEYRQQYNNPIQTIQDPPPRPHYNQNNYNPQYLPERTQTPDPSVVQSQRLAHQFKQRFLQIRQQMQGSTLQRIGYLVQFFENKTKSRTLESAHKFVAFLKYLKQSKAFLSSNEEPIEGYLKGVQRLQTIYTTVKETEKKVNSWMHKSRVARENTQQYQHSSKPPLIQPIQPIQPKTVMVQVQPKPIEIRSPRGLFQAAVPIAPAQKSPKRNVQKGKNSLPEAREAIKRKWKGNTFQLEEPIKRQKANEFNSFQSSETAKVVQPISSSTNIQTTPPTSPSIDVTKIPRRETQRSPKNKQVEPKSYLNNDIFELLNSKKCNFTSARKVFRSVFDTLRNEPLHS